MNRSFYRSGDRRIRFLFIVLLLGIVGSSSALAQTADPSQPNANDYRGSELKVITVPWLGNPNIGHSVANGSTLTLQGVARTVPGCPLVSGSWDPGDGSDPIPVNVSDPRVLEADHTYHAKYDRTPYIATLTVTDIAGNTASGIFRVVVRTPSLDVEVNMAIDHGLWYLHKTMILSSDGGTETGYWTHRAGDHTYNVAPTASAVLAFEVNGHLELADPDEDPYVDNTRRGLAHLMANITTLAEGDGEWDADGNGLALQSSSMNDRPLPAYEGGQVVDAIVASGTPSEIAANGEVNVRGRPYGAIVQDLIDGYSLGQSRDGVYSGGWRYVWGQRPDNSACQWWAIGALAAEREFHDGVDDDGLGFENDLIIVPQEVKDLNLAWLGFSQFVDWDDPNHPNHGRFGYRDRGDLVDGGGINTTAAGLVQLIADGIPSDNRNFVAAEQWMLDNWANLLDQNRVYGMFSLAKAMRLAIPAPIVLMRGTFDWYRSEDPSRPGLARHLVDRQGGDGSWSGRWSNGPLCTAWAVVVLSPTIIQPPAVAICEADPSETGPCFPITFDGGGSFHLDAEHRIVKWEWDFENDGVIDAEGKVVEHEYCDLGPYTAVLHVTDDDNPPSTDSDSCEITISPPPNDPDADPGSNYILCLGTGERLILDASGSSDPDGSIVSYGWDYDPWPLDFSYDDSDEISFDVTDYYTNLGPGSYDVGLRVVDNDGNEDVDFTTVTVLLEEDCDFGIGFLGSLSGSGLIPGDPDLHLEDGDVFFRELDGERQRLVWEGQRNKVCDLDGLAKIGSRQFAFSTKTDAYIRGQTWIWVEHKDIATVDLATGDIQILMDGSEHGLWGIDAVHQGSGGRLYFSSHRSQTLSQYDLYFEDEDVLVYDPQQGTIEMFLDMSQYGVHTLDGLHIEASDRVFFSVEATQMIGSVYLEDEDIAILNPQTGVVSQGADGDRLHIPSLDALVVGDED